MSGKDWDTLRKKCTIFDSIQEIYDKKPLKILKAAKTRWLTNGQASKWVLDRFEEILTTLDNICEDRFESELWCYMTDWIEQVTIFTLCLMTNILGITNFFSLVLQKQERKFTDISYYGSTVKTLECLPYNVKWTVCKCYITFKHHKQK